MLASAVPRDAVLCAVPGDREGIPTAPQSSARLLAWALSALRPHTPWFHLPGWPFSRISCRSFKA